MEADLEKDDLSRAQSPAGQFKVLYAWQEDLAPEGDAARASEPATTVESQDVGAAPKTEAEIQVWLVSQLSAMLHIAPQELNISEPFTRYGLDSADAVKAMGKVEAWLGRSLSPTLFWDYPNVEALARHLAGVPEVAPQPASAAMPRPEREPIAIIGMSCRFPGARNPEAFWQLVSEGIDAIGEVPADRWDIDAFYDPTPSTPGKVYTRTGGFVEQVDQFDPAFFGISPGEAASMDPQQRWALEVTWEALESTGRAPEQWAGSRTGVFIGISNIDYSALLLSDPARMNVYVGTGGAHCITANRLSYLLDFRGPSLIIDTACSSALVAIHLACQSLRSGECDAAVAGGVNLVLAPEPTVAYCQARMMSVEGRCKAFDADADGYARGEGCGVVILKRLSEALADGDPIVALVRGSAVNQDGRTNGMTAPNGLSQQAVIREALENAGVSPAQIGYVEAHGTGTPLGDPIEAQALAAVLGREPASYPCYFASVKTNIGHLEPASGIAGVIKVALSFQHGEIAPHLHLKQLNPLISLEGTRLVIPTERCPWPAEARPRMAGVSAFGFGGTNAHVVLEEAPARPAVQSRVERPLHLFTLSARSESALKESARRLADHLPTLPADSIADVCFTAHASRSQFSHRLAVTAESTASLRERLDAFATGKETPRLVSGRVHGKQKPPIAFLFTGQGSQHIGMGRQLYETQPTFRATLDRCDELLRPHLEQPLLSILFPADGQASPLDETAYTQPALFALEYALAELWRSWGVEPQAMLGHSIGEYVAACLAGVFSLEDALKLVAWRGRLMQALPRNGAMAVVFASAERAAAAIAPYCQQVSIAALNGPNNVVISGEQAALQAVQHCLAAEDIVSRPLVVSHAFHSPLMEPMLDTFEQLAGQVQFQAPCIPIVSNVTGQIMERGQIPDAGYWRRHIRAAVQFEASVKTLAEQGYRVFVELGPSPVLNGMGKRCLPDAGITWLASLEKGKEEWGTLLGSLGGLYLQGAPIDWDGFDKDYARQRLSLPTYPFERQRYWFEPTKGARHGVTAGQTLHPLLGSRLRSALKEIQFESELSVATTPYLNDHRVCGQTVFPATGYLEMARAAAEVARGFGVTALENVCFEEPLSLAEEAVVVQLIAARNGSGGETFQILSQENEGEAWRLHASGSIGYQDVASQEPGPAISLGEAQARCQEELPVDPHYERLWKIGLEYGSDFRGIEKLWRGAGEALGLVRLPNGLEAGVYAIHPALLDACLQVSAVAFAGDREDDVYLPMGVESFRVLAEPDAPVWSYVVLQSGAGASRDTPKGDVYVFDQTGQLVAQVVGLSARRTSRDALQRVGRDRVGDWLYTIQWRSQARTQAAPQPTEDQTGRWLIFADRGGLGAALAAQLSEHGAQCTLVYPGEAYQAVGDECFIDPTRLEDFERVLSKEVAPCRAIVHVWSL
ncbi:MAG TPA: beta-ketoacyl synthase N-terminal-like domain-containing protein, partial [Anaerolineae bacterium]|nr:beta-ketoacyl synthase N-terminal-like domain-containing protein [Anaerolineae bacterium]